MTTIVPRIVLTDRDTEILAALDRSPLTVRQLLALSPTFGAPFQSERRVQERLHVLARAALVRRYSAGGPPAYYQLTLLGYRILHGPKVELPSKRRFSEVGIAHQRHTRSLAEFIVHTAVSAHAHGIVLRDFARENSLRLELDGDALYPDCGFQLCTRAGWRYNFLVELDNGTERIHSSRDAESWARKIRFYDRYQDRCATRFRVLVVATRSADRVRHILEEAAAMQRNPRRTLLYAVELSTYLRESDAVGTACFRDHRGLPAAMIPGIRQLETQPELNLVPVPAPC